MTRDSGQTKDDEGKDVTWFRTTDCDQCRGVTKQLLHGFTEDGQLWKGHVCECRGYICTGCQRLEDKMAECCR